MNKKNLINEINSVIEKNNFLFSKCAELENAINEKNNLINTLEAQIESLNTEISSLIEENTKLLAQIESLNSLNDNDDIIVECKDMPTLENDANDCESKDSTDIYADKKKSVYNAQSSCSMGNKPVRPISLSDEVNKIMNTNSAAVPSLRLSAASESIGRVVVKCAEISNTFATIGDINSKDLINLALGRTEVFKSEILTLATDNNLSDDMFFAEMNVKETSVIEYFELLLKQI